MDYIIEMWIFKDTVFVVVEFRSLATSIKRNAPQSKKADSILFLFTNFTNCVRFVLFNNSLSFAVHVVIFLYWIAASFSLERNSMATKLNKMLSPPSPHPF